MTCFRSGVLIAALTALFMAVDYFIGGQTGSFIALAVALGASLFAHYKMILSMQDTREIDRGAAPDLFNMVSRLAQLAGSPMSRPCIIDTDQPDAFAIGRKPQNSAVAEPSGQLRRFNADEVAGVVARELAQVALRDTLTMATTATLAGAISRRSQFGLFFGGGNSRNNPLGGAGVLLMSLLCHSRQPWCRWQCAGRANTRPIAAAPKSRSSRWRWPWH